jgi:endonuclease/exonuclease/phosphatase family metal-dependent hydrolase
LRVVSYNIHGCVGSDGRRDVERIATVLSLLAPDVAALQEVDSRSSRGGLDQANLLARRLGMDAIEGPLLRERQGHYGNAVLSRWPLRRLAEGAYTAQNHERRGWLAVEVAPPGRAAWRVLVTHLDLRGTVRTAQLRELAAVAVELDGPLVLAGDLNEWRPWRRGLAGLPRTVDLLPARPSFPALLPILALDRLGAKRLAPRRGPCVDRSTLARRASDHLPVWAEFAAAG